MTCNVPTNPNTNANATTLNENFQRYNCPPETQNYDSPDMTDEELELYWKMLKDTEIATLSDQLSYPVPSNVDISNPDHQREQCGSTDCNTTPQNERCRLHRGSGTGYDKGRSGTRIPGYDLYMSSFFMWFVFFLWIPIFAHTDGFKVTVYYRLSLDFDEWLVYIIEWKFWLNLLIARCVMY